MAKKKRSAKSKVPAAPESSHAARGKVPKLGASSSLSSIREQGSSGQFWERGRTPHPMAKVSKVTGPQLRSPHVAVAKSPFGRTAKPPLDILPISVWSPSAQSAELPSGVSEGEGRKHLGQGKDEDLFLTNAELVVEVVSSILQDSDLKRADAMSLEEALALLLQGAATVCPDAFICSFHHCFKLSINFI